MPGSLTSKPCALSRKAPWLFARKLNGSSWSPGRMCLNPAPDPRDGGYDPIKPRAQ
jgi:hypothetical protein